MCFRCLILSLLFCVALSMDLFVLWFSCLTVLVKCLVKQFTICLGVFCYFVIEGDGVVVCGWRCSIG